MYAFFWITGWVGFQPPSMNLILFFIPGFFFACVAALGEELGWRGFLVPAALPHLGYHKTILLS
jgi:membrane protease YdiL (CAAX protease family)